MDRDRAADRTARLVGDTAPAGADKPWHPAARRAAFWEADIVPLNVSFQDDRNAAPAFAIVAAGGFIIHGNVIGQRPTSLAGRGRELIDAVSAAGRALGELPEVLHVRDAALAEAVAPELLERGISVIAAPMPELDEALDTSLAHLCGDGPRSGMTTPDTWAETESTPAEAADFHAAAAAFHRGTPWTRLNDDAPLELRFPDGTTGWACVMGGAGVEFGLSLYSDYSDLERLYESEEPPMEVFAAMQGWAVTASFEPRSRLSRRMQREVVAAGWEVAGPDAYPMLFGLHVPERRLTGRHVRLATLALRAVLRAIEEHEGSAPAGGEPADGVQVIWPEGEESPWPALVAAHPIGPEGPNADPMAALAAWGRELEVNEADEHARLHRFTAWLDDQKLSKAARIRHFRNADAWCEYLAGMAVPASAATEYDLREFLYDWFPRKVIVPGNVRRGVAKSVGTYFRWQAEHEGIRYPWAEAVLAEHDGVAEERGDVPAGAFWDHDVKEWRGALWADLDDRVMLHDHDLPGTRAGWPPVMDDDVATLERELQRRWLIWYDEAVRTGVTELEELFEVLASRQRGWENTPNPSVGGRTPQQVVAAYEEKALADGRARGFPIGADGEIDFTSLGGDDLDDDDNDVIDLFGEETISER